MQPPSSRMFKRNNISTFVSHRQCQIFWSSLFLGLISRSKRRNFRECFQHLQTTYALSQTCTRRKISSRDFNAWKREKKRPFFSSSAYVFLGSYWRCRFALQNDKIFMDTVWSLKSYVLQQVFFPALLTRSSFVHIIHPRFPKHLPASTLCSIWITVLG